MNTQITIVTIFAALAAIASAYDFSDPVYNQILADDLEELHESLDETYLHPRSRRDEEAANVDKCKDKWHRKKKFCCAEDTFTARFEKDKDVKKECFKQLYEKDKDTPRGEFDPFRCDKVDKHRKEMTCVFQCVGQKNNILDTEGSPKEVEFTTFVKDLMSKESWFASLQDKVISTCLAEAKNATANRDTSDSGSCNPAAVKLGHCLFREIQLSCPADQIKDEKACAKARDKIKRHSDFFGQAMSDD